MSPAAADDAPYSYSIHKRSGGMVTLRLEGILLNLTASEATILATRLNQAAVESLVNELETLIRAHKPDGGQS